ncbi:uncharacterized protein LOC121372537 isoform X2 [Gigantopelta aegis]|uniref:uncharacterized protein LOC121372537 isoform X2 n=1 Tax=Gigantopelta aegis TaxID=1735272 RepID=UPI001B88AE1D|nr:uncharacterized protein LOC121372537 isoform X2 [Gigantopelta aegis]
MTMFRNVFSGCVSDRSTRTKAMRSHKLKFGAPMHVALKNGYLPTPLIDILVYIAQEGVGTVDLFRRPGNPADIRHIVKRLSEGKPVTYTRYSFYTLASVLKRYLLRLPGGVFTPQGEECLLQVLSLGHRSEQFQAVHDFIQTLSSAHQHLISLLFGTWFRIVNHSEINFMTLEALSRSCAGSVFHTCADDPAKVEKASRLMQLMVDNFGTSVMFGRENIEYFTETTRTGIHVREMFRYEYQYPSEDLLPHVSDEFIEMTRMEGDSQREHEHHPSESPEPSSPFMGRPRTSKPENSQLTITVTTVSAPEVSIMPSPEVSKRPKSVEDSLNEVTNYYQSRSLSRFNSVKRKQLERLRQRSDWFLGPNRERMSIEKKESLSKKGSGNSGASVTKASSEGAVLDVLNDTDSVFSDNTSRSESPASEPVRSLFYTGRRDIMHSDTLAEMSTPELHHFHHSEEVTDEEMSAREDHGEVTDEEMSAREDHGEVTDEEMSAREDHGEVTDEEISAREDPGDITDEDMTESDIRCYVVDHQFGMGGKHLDS